LSENGPAGRYVESQQPLVSARSSLPGCEPSTSASSATLKIAQFPVHAFECMIETVDESHASLLRLELLVVLVAGRVGMAADLSVLPGDGRLAHSRDADIGFDR
jgi:hypothetical protein